MTVYYILLFIAALMFAGQFLFTKQFQRLNGNSLGSTVKLSFFAFIVIALFFFVKAQIGADGFRFGFSWFTLFMTLGIAVVSVSCTYLGVKLLGIGNMSVYSAFMMIGSMVLPSFVGIVFYGEELTWLKGIAIALMLLAVAFTAGTDGEKSNKKALLFYIGVFILNGLIGVFFTVHNNQPTWTAYFETVDGKLTANSDVFMSWYGISTALLSGAIMLVMKIVEKRKIKTFETSKTDGAGLCSTENSATEAVTENGAETVSDETAKKPKMSAWKVLLLSVLIAAGFGLVNGLGNYFITLGTKPGALGSSVTFPIVNGGTIVFSTLIGFFAFKEKITWKTWLGLALVVVSTTLFMLAQ
ncbi:MAG: hypothetical protein IJ317_02180 [Clostridia bacterium]|nr:hypothetical protein [Clostridia bacterium]